MLDIPNVVDHVKGNESAENCEGLYLSFSRYFQDNDRRIYKKIAELFKKVEQNTFVIAGMSHHGDTLKKLDNFVEDNTSKI